MVSWNYISVGKKRYGQRKYADEPVFVLVPEEDYEILNENIAYFTNSSI